MSIFLKKMNFIKNPKGLEKFKDIEGKIKGIFENKQKLKENESELLVELFSRIIYASNEICTKENIIYNLSEKIDSLKDFDGINFYHTNLKNKDYLGYFVIAPDSKSFSINLNIDKINKHFDFEINENNIKELICTNEDVQKYIIDTLVHESIHMFNIYKDENDLYKYMIENNCIIEEALTVSLTKEIIENYITKEINYLENNISFIENDVYSIRNLSGNGYENTNYFADFLRTINNKACLDFYFNDNDYLDSLFEYCEFDKYSGILTNKGEDAFLRVVKILEDIDIHSLNSTNFLEERKIIGELLENHFNNLKNKGQLTIDSYIENINNLYNNFPLIRDTDGIRNTMNDTIYFLDIKFFGDLCGVQNRNLRLNNVNDQLEVNYTKEQLNFLEAMYNLRISNKETFSNNDLIHEFINTNGKKETDIYFSNDLKFILINACSSEFNFIEFFKKDFNNIYLNNSIEEDIYFPEKNKYKFLLALNGQDTNIENINIEDLISGGNYLKVIAYSLNTEFLEKLETVHKDIYSGKLIEDILNYDAVNKNSIIDELEHSKNLKLLEYMQLNNIKCETKIPDFSYLSEGQTKPIIFKYLDDGNLNMVQYLLDNGYDISIKENKYDKSLPDKNINEAINEVKKDIVDMTL